MELTTSTHLFLDAFWKQIGVIFGVAKLLGALRVQNWPGAFAGEAKAKASNWIARMPAGLNSAMRQNRCA